jgi:putative ABC transport system permease protein
MGLEPEGELRRLVGRGLSIHPVPVGGVVLTAKLADVLDLRSGDTVTVEVLEGSRAVRRIVVAGTVDELIGLSAYLDVRTLNRLVREGGTLSGAFLTVDPRAEPALHARLKRMPAAAGVSNRVAALASFEQTLAESIGIITTVLILFAGAIAFAMIYNAARIALSERGRELASLRVLGFTRAEIAGMLLGEQALLTLLAIPLGLGMGYAFSALISRNYQWELYRIPLFISGDTYAFAIAVVLGAALVSGAVVRRRLNRLDLIAVLKTRE